MLDFNIPYLLLVIAVSAIPLFFIFRTKDFQSRFFFSVIVFFVFFYCGFGAALNNANYEYINYYVIYFLVLWLTIKLVKIKVRPFNINKEHNLEENIKRVGVFVISFYTLLNLSNLFFPEFLLNRLFNPPSPDLRSQMDIIFNTQTVTRSPMESVIYYLFQLVLPFYFWALYLFKDNIIKLFFIVIFNDYIEYCAHAYLARSIIFVSMLIIGIAYYSSLSEKARKKFIIGVIISIPLIGYAFFQYSLLRAGDTASRMSMSEANQALIYQEISYPLQYDDYKNFFNIGYFQNYIEWILALPLPGFMKSVTQNFNQLFSVELLGVSQLDKNFYVLLPGLVGESLFICGKYFFIFHAMFLGFILKVSYLFLRKSKTFIFLFYYCAFYFSFDLCRGGTVSIYPFVFKHLVIFALFAYFVFSKKYYRNANRFRR